MQARSRFENEVRWQTLRVPTPGHEVVFPQRITHAISRKRGDKTIVASNFHIYLLVPKELFRLARHHQTEIGLNIALRAAEGSLEKLLGTNSSELVKVTPFDRVWDVVAPPLVQADGGPTRDLCRQIRMRGHNWCFMIG